MVVSRSDSNSRQRKKGGESLVQTPISENGKRTKVHAQRKFAQGSALSSPALTPVKDKHKTNGSLVSTEIIPAKRPKTHDFLTFLCLRGTPILPTRLDFFSISPTDNQNDEDITGSSCNSIKPPVRPQCNSKNIERTSESLIVPGKQRNETHLQNGTMGPRRRSSAVPLPTSAVQALKKKYQDQRLSKQNRSGVLNKLAQRVKDKNMVRTRSAGQVEHQIKKLPVETKSSPIKTKPASKSIETSSNSESRRATRSSGIPPSPVVQVIKVHKKRIGLRSGGHLPVNQDIIRKKPKKSVVPVVNKTAGKPVASSMSDFSSDDDEPLSKKAKTKIGKTEIVKAPPKQVPVHPRPQQVRKKALSPVRIQTRSRKSVETHNATPESKEVATPQPKPQARLSRRTKEMAAVYMELLVKKWRDPDDDDDDDDSLSLYSLPEVHKSSSEKKTTASSKKVMKKKSEQNKKEPEKKEIEQTKKKELEQAKKKELVPTKKKEKTETPDMKSKDIKKKERIIRTRQSISAKSSSPLQTITSSPKKNTLTTAGPQRRSLRGHLPPELPTLSQSKLKESSEEADEEFLIKKTAIKKVESSKNIDNKKKFKKHDKVEKTKSSLSSIAKRTRLRSEKLKLSKESKKATLNKLLEQTKKKYLCTRKSKEACIQELVQSTLERLNKEKEKEEKKELKRAMELDLIQVEQKEKEDSKTLDPILLDKKLRTLACSSQEEKSPVKAESVLSTLKTESKSLKIEQKGKMKGNKIMSPLETMPRFVAKKSASIVPPPRKKISLISRSLDSVSPRKAALEQSVSLPCTPQECRPTMAPPGTSKLAYHCTTCGRGDSSQQLEVTEICKKISEVEKTGNESVNNAVKNLNWGNVSSFKLQTHSVQVSNTVVVTQKAPAELIQANTNQQKQNTSHLLPAQPVRLTNVTDMKTFVNGLAMLQPTNKNEQLVLLAPPNTGAGTGKYIVCRKDELAALESNSSCSSSGMQFMVLPSGVHTVSPDKIPMVATPQLKDTSSGSNLPNLKNKKIETNGSTPNQEVKISLKTSSTPNSSQTVSVPKSPEEKRPIFQRRHEKSILYKKSNAFSPENESSVYAFQMDPEEEPTGIPFRRKNKEDSNSATTPPTPPATHSVACGTESLPSKVMQTSSSASTSSTPPSLHTPRNVSSTSIAVQVNFDEVASTSSESPSEPCASPSAPLSSALRNSFECSTQTEDENEDDPLFYIPLQTVTPTPQQLFEGVKFKLGNESSTGSNQRVIMRAKLVTKLPERFSAALNATGMVRSSQHPTSTMANATANALLKSPLIGTVQPTARCNPQPVATSTSHTVPTQSSTASTAIGTQKSAPPKFQRISAKQTKAAVPATPVVKTSQAPVSEAATVMKHPPAVKTPPITKQSAVNSKALPSGSKTAGLKPQKVMNKRSSTDYSNPTPSVSTSKPAPKKPPVQRQTSSSGSGSGSSKIPKVLEAAPTPTTFPKNGGQGQLIEAPTFYPTEKDFQDPLEYIDRIRPTAEQFGLCRIVPPSSFKPECKVSDDMRFTAYNHYVHKMLNRWGPNVRETTAIKKYLKSQNVAYTHPPWIGGMEIDLPRFYQTVKQLGGLMEVIEKKRWQKVADLMKIPKSAQDRVTKLDDIYCKFLLAYDTLTPEERQTLYDEVEAEWSKKQEDSNDDDAVDNFDESEECITKGRSMPLNAFYRIARNTMSMWFRTPEPAAGDVETEYWRIAQERTSHVCVHAGSIDSGVWGYGFPCNKNSPCAKHPWNLKVLSNNSGSVLRSMGSVMGVTVPTLHVGMLFSTCCWYRDPHGLPWIEYLHTGASKIWYGIPDSQSQDFRKALKSIVPKYCRDQTIWLPSDTAMVPPSMLIPHGVSVCRTVQEPGQFILVFPRAFTSSISTGYLVSESVYFAQPDWLNTADDVFKELKDSVEPTMFSLERLLFSIPQDHRANVDVLRQIQPKLVRIVQQEGDQREILRSLGLKSSERLPLPEAVPNRRRQRTASDDDGDHECEECRANLYLSLVTNSHTEAVYCLPHAINLLTKKRHQIKFCKLLFTYEMDELQELLHQLDEKIEVKSSKKSYSKHGNSYK